MELKDQIQKYFKLNNKEKSDVLVQIIRIYTSQNQIKYNGLMKVRDLIDIDIEIYKEHDEFELVQALTDIKEAIAELEDEIRKELE
jgi:hypothetical protein